MTTTKTKRRWFQFRLRTLLLVVTVFAVCMAWYVSRAQRQRRTVAALRAMGGRVVYNADLRLPELAPAWLQRLLGDDYFFSVSHLDLSRNTGVDDETLVHLDELAHLRSLDLGQTQVTDAGLGSLKGMSELESLKLEGIPITNEGLAHLAGLRKLHFLAIDSPQVTDQGLVSLKGMTKLRTLSLRRANLTDAGLEHLDGLRSVEYLYLSGSGITDGRLADLKGMTQLRVLGLGGTKVTPTGAHRLFDDLPNLYAVDLDFQRITR